VSDRGSFINEDVNHFSSFNISVDERNKSSQVQVSIYCFNWNWVRNIPFVLPIQSKDITLTSTNHILNG
jgi:hypothetical protein